MVLNNVIWSARLFRLCIAAVITFITLWWNQSKCAMFINVQQNHDLSHRNWETSEIGEHVDFTESCRFGQWRDTLHDSDLILCMTRKKWMPTRKGDVSWAFFFCWSLSSMPFFGLVSLKLQPYTSAGTATDSIWTATEVFQVNRAETSRRSCDAGFGNAKIATPRKVSCGGGDFMRVVNSRAKCKRS